MKSDWEQLVDDLREIRRIQGESRAVGIEINGLLDQMKSHVERGQKKAIEPRRFNPWMILYGFAIAGSLLNAILLISTAHYLNAIIPSVAFVMLSVCAYLTYKRSFQEGAYVGKEEEQIAKWKRGEVPDWR